MEVVKVHQYVTVDRYNSHNLLFTPNKLKGNVKKNSPL